jgi:hypothetical protein
MSNSPQRLVEALLAAFRVLLYSFAAFFADFSLASISSVPTFAS